MCLHAGSVSAEGAYKAPTHSPPSAGVGPATPLASHVAPALAARSARRCIPLLLLSEGRRVRELGDTVPACAAATPI